jgi:hypothetical protein
VVDHAGRLVCATCLAKTTAASAEAKPKRSFAGLQCAVTLAAAVLVLWMIFYAVGLLLLSVPPQFHEGTIWRRMGME